MDKNDWGEGLMTDHGHESESTRKQEQQEIKLREGVRGTDLCPDILLLSLPG